MTDKERILSAVVAAIIPCIMFATEEEQKEVVKHCLFNPHELKQGDLVFAFTTIFSNDFSVGFVHEVKENCVVIRKIGSEKLCNYYNESFCKINKERLGYEVLEGMQYKTYQKVLKAFEYTNYCTRFKGISFDEDKCTVQARTMFEDDLFFEVSFAFEKKTTVAEIGKILERADKKARMKKK